MIKIGMPFVCFGHSHIEFFITNDMGIHHEQPFVSPPRGRRRRHRRSHRCRRYNEKEAKNAVQNLP